MALSQGKLTAHLAGLMKSCMAPFKGTCEAYLFEKGALAHLQQGLLPEGEAKPPQDKEPQQAAKDEHGTQPRVGNGTSASCASPVMI